MDEKWTIIKPKTGWFELNLKELKQYKDLVYLFVKRTFTAQYKQTILGPLWFIINPLLTTVVFTVIFGNIAGLSTDGVPQFVFYLCGTAIWQYFSTCLSQISSTFIDNAGIFGKVYFPRITMPLSTTIFSLINFGVNMGVAVLFIIYYIMIGENVRPNLYILLLPLLVLQTAMLGLGVGIIISSLTTKYRDLRILVSFGIQLWMYLTPVAYSLSQFSDKAQKILMLNPMSPIVNNFRYVLLGCGSFVWGPWLVSVIITVVLLLAGILLFNKVEKTFMDTV